MIDFHCHLDLFPDPSGLITECERTGCYVLSVTTTPSAWRGTSALSRGSKRIRTALGLHPELAYERGAELALFDALLPEARYVGEIGLDRSRGTEDRWPAQEEVFRHVLSSCEKAGGRIMSIHSRRAASEVLDALKVFPRAGTPVLHWFSGTREQLRRAVALNCWFSVGPSMLRGQRGRELLAHMPRDRVLTESDGPFAQVDARPVLPTDIGTALQYLSEVWSVSYGEADARVTENFRRLVISAEERA